ncbi:MAG: hypothetical protein AAGF90_21805, partial [Pseudomonadota bacterium]
MAISPLSEARAERFGAKAARLARLVAAGAPTPPGFAFADDADETAIRAGVAGLEGATGRGFGAADRPLLVALRSSPVDERAPSAPSLLNLGLSSNAVPGLAAEIGARAALDLRRRLVQGFATAVMGADPEAFENALYDRMKLSGADGEEDLDEAALRALVADFERLAEDETDEPVPEDPIDQLLRAVAAARRAWSAPTARILRRARGVEGDAGQGMIAQAMALGLGPDDAPSGAGVASLRSEATGARGLTGRFLSQAQGADVLMGLRTPRLLTEAARREAGQGRESFEELAP